MKFGSASLWLSTLLASWPQSLRAHSYEGQAHLQAVSLQKPSDPDLFVVDQQNIFRAIYREGGTLDLASWLKFQYAFYFVAQSLSGRDDLDHLGLLFIDPRHRTLAGDFYLQNLERQDVYALVDRLHLRMNLGRQRLIVGRAPLELSKSFIFRPNDIFAPSGYSSLDPSNKTGVDSVQLSGPLAPLGEWKLIGIVGYEERDAARVDFNGRYLKPSNRPSAKQSSLLASYLNTWREYSFQLTVGTYRDHYIVMGSSEGEISETIGLRVEGKQIVSREDQSGQFSFVLGLDYRWSDTILLVGEYFLNGEGLERIEDFENVSSSAYRPLTQFGRHYLGLGLTYELTPTLKLRGLAQQNLSDSSRVLTSGLAYSWSERLDVSLALLSGQGAASQEGILQSEYGAYPDALALEAIYRW